MSATGEDGYVILPEERWAGHPWLRRLQSGSDMDSDSALFFTGTSEAETAALQQLVVQYRVPDREWLDAISAAGAIFPSRDWAQATVGWYRPDRAYLTDQECAGTEYRALIPLEWQVPRG